MTYYQQQNVRHGLLKNMAISSANENFTSVLDRLRNEHYINTKFGVGVHC